MAFELYQLYALGILVVGYLWQVSHGEPYTDWYNLGPHGLPLNLLGYGAEKVMRRFSVDTRDGSVFQDKKGELWAQRTAPGGSISYLSAANLKPRDHAEMQEYVVPQIQVEGNEDVAPVLRKYIEDMAERDPRFIMHGSNLEISDVDSIWLVRKKNWQMVGEFGHVHDEGSSHFILSVPDAAEVLEKGWGERHGMSGKMTPLTYMFIYAPRNDEEVEEWKKIAEASAAFISAE